MGKIIFIFDQKIEKKKHCFIDLVHYSPSEKTVQK